MAKYRRMTYEDRCQIRAILQAKEPIEGFAKKLGFHKSTIYREIIRNQSRKKEYRAKAADEKARKKHRACRRKMVITGQLEGQVLTHLFSDWSPEQIAGRLSLEKAGSVSHQSIYNYIHRHLELAPYLRRFNRRGVSRVKMKAYRRGNMLSIDSRPPVSNHRRRFGDWERDSMYGAHAKQLLVCAERKSRLIKIGKSFSTKGSKVAQLTNCLLKTTKKKVHTITNDNGPEFRDSKAVVGTVYYCHPRCPQERGTIENTIGLLRQYVKRSTDLEAMSQNDIQTIEDLINFRPRKCLDYKTPYEIFNKTSVALAV